MADQRFEAELARVVSEKADWRAPTELRLRVADIPDEFAPPSRLSRLRSGAPRLARFAALAGAVVLLAGFAWVRYEAVSPGSGGTPLTIETEAAPSPLPSGAVWLCMQAEAGPVRVELTGSELVFFSTGNGAQEHLVWPHGFSARLVGGTAELVASDGKVLARDGDVIPDIGGGLGISGDAFHVCSVNNVEYLP